MSIQEYIKSQLNEEQGKAAVHHETSSLILAGAGSGKTRVLTYKIAYLLYEKDVRPDEILAVTFTNKAAKEMKERLVKISEEIAAQRDSTSAYQNFHATSFKRIGTFHGMFLRFLKEEMKNADLGWTASFGVYDEQEAQSVLKEIIKELKMEEDVEIKEARGFISKLKGKGITAKQFGYGGDGYEQTMGMIYERYEKKLKECNSCDFDDLLLIPYLIMKQRPEILARRQKKFRYILVDEAQDTNGIQFELMKFLT